LIKKLRVEKKGGDGEKKKKKKRKKANCGVQTGPRWCDICGYVANQKKGKRKGMAREAVMGVEDLQLGGRGKGKTVRQRSWKWT